MNRTARVEALHWPFAEGLPRGTGHRVRCGIAELGTDDDKEHKQSPGNVDADATVRAMGTPP